MSQVWPYVFTKQLRVEKGYATALFGKCMNSNCANNPYAPGLNMYTMCGPISLIVLSGRRSRRMFG